MTGDIPWCLAGGGSFEDADDDHGLLRNDDELTGFARYQGIAIGSAAGIPAFADDPCHAAADLVREILKEQGADETTDADLDDIRPAVMNGADFDAGVCQTLVDTGEVLLIAGNSVEGLDDEDIIFTVATGIHGGQHAVAAED